DLLLEDVAAISRLTGLGIDVSKDILKHGFLVTQKPAGFPVELPQNAGLAYGEYQFLFADIHQHALKHLVQIQRFAGNMLKVPDELAIVRIEGQRRTREEPFVAWLCPA